jgi:L-alanine-DL-glutamate epimerase-like enolase superfamily enzyme
LKIAAVNVSLRDMALARPYSIAGETFTSASNAFVEIVDASGLHGIGCASPAPEVTGESMQACVDALRAGAPDWLVHREIESPFEMLRRWPAALSSTPAARAALDMALFDLHGKRIGRSVGDLLGNAHEALPTSVTLGIMPLAETLGLADEYLALGFRAMKLKIGDEVERDIETTLELRQRIGPAIGLRVDANGGYDETSLARYCDATREAALELIEQPLPRGDHARLGAPACAGAAPFCADEDLRDERDARDLLAADARYAGFNVKLMKCGGILAASSIAALAARHRRWLMWGCMDESIVGISAALNVAYSSEATRYIDLDGSLDLAIDVVSGGFRIEQGLMRTLKRPGLGVEKIHEG